MGLISVLWGIVAMLWMVLAFIQLLGWGNWFMIPFSERSRLMAEHATSGIKFAGKVSQLITASTGFDDWEWGVTLWGRTPEYIKEIVYTMRVDEASAKYAAVGPFDVGYVMPVAEVLKHLKLAQ